MSYKKPSASESQIAYTIGGETYPPKKPWVPWTMSPKGLVPVAFFTILLIVSLALLQWQDTRHGAIFFSDLSDGFSSREILLYRYLPTIIIVLYGTIWSWVDLDVKRLEPWYQLSHTRGSLGSNSLLLQYPLQFLPLVPFNAARRKQWVVVSASMVMILVVWAVTPLQNGVFLTRIVTIHTPTRMNAVGSLVRPTDQTANLERSFLMASYGVSWLGQQPPAFTTERYALAPFKISDDTTRTHGDPRNQTISADTVLYGTSLDCVVPRNISFDQEFSSVAVTFDDGNGCAPVLSFSNSSTASESTLWDAYYIPYWSDPNLERSLAYSGCPVTSQHTFLAVWSRANSVPQFDNSSEGAALFCTPSYYKQAVNATIKIADSTVVSSVPTGPKVSLQEADFNITRFEYLLGVGTTIETVQYSDDQADPAIFTDASNSVIIHQDSQLLDLRVGVPTNNMVGYALGLSDRALSKLTDPSQLQKAFERAHQLLFAMAVHDAMPKDRYENDTEGILHSTLQAVQVSPVFAFLSQGLLIMILILTWVLLFSSPSRRNCLTRDPGSLAEIVVLVKAGMARSLLGQCDVLSEQELTRTIGTAKFYLETGGSGARPNLDMLDDADNRVMLTPTDPPPCRIDAAQKPSGPIEHSWLVGGPVILLLAVIIVLLVFLRQKILHDNGLPLPFTNSTAQKLLTSVLPTLLATLMEPFWVLITRIACVMRPMEELRGCSADAKKSLLLKYSSLPPQLNTWRALSAGHIMLAALTLVALLANVLTVAAAGLFFENAGFHTQETLTRRLFLASTASDLAYSPRGPVGNNTFLDIQADAYLVALSNLTGGTSLPPWVSPHNYFLPVDNGQSGSRRAQKYVIRATGYGGELDCQELTSAPSDNMVRIDFDPTATKANMVTTHRHKDGSLSLCRPKINPDTEIKMTLNGIPQGRKGLEFAGNMRENETRNDADVKSEDFCDKAIFKGWVRADLEMESGTENRNSSGKTPLRPVKISNLQSSFVVCQPRLRATEFEITLSPTGSVLDTVQIGDPIYDDPSTNLSTIISETNELIAGSGRPGTRYLWHNGTLAGDFPQEMIRALSKSNAFVDPAAPIPDFAAASSVVQDLYSRLFVIQMSLRTSLLLPSPASAPPIPIRLEVFETRIFMSEAMFCISLAILCIDLLVAVVFYIRVPRPFLPRMPTSIASQLAFCGNSHVWDDVRTAVTSAPDGGLTQLDRDGRKYGYGSYVGQDGKPHVGIERVPLVQPLGQVIKRRKWGWI